MPAPQASQVRLFYWFDMSCYVMLVRHEEGGEGDTDTWPKRRGSSGGGIVNLGKSTRARGRCVVFWDWVGILARVRDAEMGLGGEGMSL